MSKAIQASGYLLILALFLAPPSARGDACSDRWPAAATADCREAVFAGDVAAVAMEDRMLVASAGRGGAGFSVWMHGEELEPLYQDLGNPSHQVRVLRYGGVHYAFAAGPLGVFVYDLTQAQALVRPCLDDRGTVCPGVFQGRLGDTRDVVELDVFERGGSLYVVAGGRDHLPVEIWSISNPAIPALAVREFSSWESPGPRSVRDLASVELDGGVWSAVSDLGAL